MSKVLQQRGFGSLPSSTETNMRNHVKSILTTVEADTPSIRRIDPIRYDVSSPHNRMQFFKPNQSIIPLLNRLIDDCYEEKEVQGELLDKEKYASNFKKLLIESREWGTKSKHQQTRMTRQFLMTSNNVTFIASFILYYVVLDMPEDIKISLILERPFLSIAHAKTDVFKRKITLRLRRNQVEALGPTIEEGEVIDAPMEDIVKSRNNDNNITDFAVIENMDAYRDEGMVNVIVSAHDKLHGILHPYQKLKRFYKGVLNLGPEYIRDAKIEELLTRGHVSIHEMD
ncbi:hypothetical protein Tco_1182299 [Tanacetum coccineum]